MKLSQTQSSDAKLVRRDLGEVTMTLDELYKDDPGLLEFYEENLSTYSRMGWRTHHCRIGVYQVRVEKVPTSQTDLGLPPVGEVFFRKTGPGRRQKWRQTNMRRQF